LDTLSGVVNVGGAGCLVVGIPERSSGTAAVRGGWFVGADDCTRGVALNGSSGCMLEVVVAWCRQAR
jgi:hypothetical protein